MAASVTWACTRCTLRNDNELTECAACSSPKPKGDQFGWLPNDKQRAVAASNSIPYTKNKLSIPSKTSGIGCIINSKHWDKFFQKKIAPKPGDWLDDHDKDRKGQTFLEWYKRKNIRYPSSIQDTIGLITIGNFNINLDIMDKKNNDDKEEKKDNDNNKDIENSLFSMLSSIVEIYYGMKVKIIPSIKSESVTSRFNDFCGVKQLLTTDIHDILSNIISNNKQLFCLMGISIIDLYPKPEWNFVFGQARITTGTGVFSFARYLPGFYQIVDNDKNDNQLTLLKKLCEGKTNDVTILQKLNFDKNKQILFFRRCIKVLVHEIGHLFGIKHCIYHECIMNGSNHLDESDAKPVYLCPVCLHKLYFCRLRKCKKPLDLLDRYCKLAALYEKYGLKEDGMWYQQRVEFLTKNMK